MSVAPTDAGVELLEQLGKTGSGTSPLGCMQCGMCAASCPLGEAMEFPPRKLILQTAAGNLDQVLASPSLWMCVGCYTCSHRCPRDIELTDGLWPALRDRSMQAGFPAAGGTAGDVPEPVQVRQHVGQVAAAATGLGQGAGRAGAGSVQGAPAGGRAVAGGLLPVVLSAEPGRHAGLGADHDQARRDLGRAGGEGEVGRRMRTHVRRGRALRDAGRGEPQAARSAGIRHARHARPARLSRAARLLSALRRLVSGAALHDVPGRAAGAVARADRQADRGDGDVSRQLLRRVGGAAATIRRGRCCS